MIKDSPNPPGQPDFDTSTLHEVAYRAINHYLNPAKPIPEPADGLFTVRADLGTETLLVNAPRIWRPSARLLTIWRLKSRARNVMSRWAFVGCWKGCNCWWIRR